MLKQIQLLCFIIIIFKSFFPIVNIHENLHQFSSWYRNSLKAACQKFHKMLKATLSCSFLFAQEPRFINKKQKPNCLFCPWNHLLLIQPLPFRPISFLSISLHPFFHNRPLRNKLTTQFLPAVALSRLYNLNLLPTLWIHWEKESSEVIQKIEMSEEVDFFGVFRQVWKARTTFFFICTCNTLM